MKISLFNSLKFRMPFLVSLGIIPLIVLAIFYASNRASKTIRAENSENLALKAKFLAESVTRWDESNILALKNLSTDGEIVDFEPTAQTEKLKNLVKNYSHIYLSFTVDSFGQNVARSDGKPPKYYSDRPYFKGAMAGQITYQSLIGRTSKKPAVCISAPVPQSSTPLGVVVICTDLKTLARQVGELKFGETGYALVVDRHGLVLAHPEPEILSGERLKDKSSYPPIKKLLSGNCGNFSFTDYEGVKWVSESRRLDNGWGIVVLQEKKEFERSAQEFQELALLLGAIAVVAVGAITWLLANHLMKPILSLTKAASEFKSGSLSAVNLQIKRKDELGALASVFCLMAAQLKNSFDSLEEKVAVRTTELEASKELAETESANAKKANLAKDRFLANISHELRTPLNSILGYAQIMLTSPGSPEDTLKLRIIKQSGTHLLTLINDILDFSKAQVNKLELNLQPLLLPTMLEDTLGMLKIEASEKGIDLVLKTEGKLPAYIKADNKRLQQVLLNLLSNAVKFTETGSVILKVSHRGGIEASTSRTLRFSVIDTGIGIEKESLSKIFKPFEQGGDQFTKARGTGLGLAISREIIELMGGKLLVSSQLGRGSTFWFEVTFDVLKITPEQSTPLAIVGYSGEQKKILVVDDSHENRELLRNILSPIGFNLIEAKNGKEGFDSTLNDNPDLIITDMMMPVKTGLTMVLSLRKIRKFKELPIIAVSAAEREIMEERSLGNGCNSFLPKPIDEQSLLNLLANFLHLDWIYQNNKPLLINNEK